MLASRQTAEATSPAPSSGHGAKSEAQREAVIIALLRQRSVKEAARSVGIGVQTLYSWLQEPAFALGYLEARMEAFGQAGARCQQCAASATTTLQNIAGDATTPASLKVRAIALALSHAQAASNEDIDTYIAMSEATPKAVLKLIGGAREAAGGGARERHKKAA
jgi:transposase